MDCKNEYMNEHRFKRIEEDLKELQDKNSRDHKEFYKRIEDTEKDMVESRGDRKHMKDKLDKIDSNVEALIQKPGKRWESVVGYVLSALVGAFIAYLLNGGTII